GPAPRPPPAPPPAPPPPAADSPVAPPPAVLTPRPPAGAAHFYAERIARGTLVPRHLLDVVYHPWPTPLAVAARPAGTAVASGFTLLLHQAPHQVTLMTAQPAPPAAMRPPGQSALTGYPLPLPATPRPLSPGRESCWPRRCGRDPTGVGVVAVDAESAGSAGAQIGSDEGRVGASGRMVSTAGRDLAPTGAVVPG